MTPRGWYLLTQLQRGVLARLREAGAQGAALHAYESWRRGERVAPDVLEHVRTWDVLRPLVADFETANDHATLDV